MTAWTNAYSSGSIDLHGSDGLGGASPTLTVGTLPEMEPNAARIIFHLDPYMSLKLGPMRTPFGSAQAAFGVMDQLGTSAIAIVIDTDATRVRGYHPGPGESHLDSDASLDTGAAAGVFTSALGYAPGEFAVLTIAEGWQRYTLQRYAAHPDDPGATPSESTIGVPHQLSSQWNQHAVGVYSLSAGTGMVVEGQVDRGPDPAPPNPTIGVGPHRVGYMRLPSP